MLRYISSEECRAHAPCENEQCREVYNTITTGLQYSASCSCYVCLKMAFSPIPAIHYWSLPNFGSNQNLFGKRSIVCQSSHLLDILTGEVDKTVFAHCHNFSKTCQGPFYVEPHVQCPHEYGTMFCI